MKFYIDTSIWRDYYEDRRDKFNFFGEHAFKLFLQIKEREDIVVYSELVIKELKNDFDDSVIMEIFDIMKKENLLEKTDINKSDVEEATKIYKKLKIPFGDCLHAILARKHSAIMVTRDKHFELLRDVVEVKKPEDLI